MPEKVHITYFIAHLNLGYLSESTAKQYIPPPIYLLHIYPKSSKTLDPAHISLLRKGLNFAVVPPSLPTEEIVTSTELACKSLDQETAANLRSEVARSVSKRTK